MQHHEDAARAAVERFSRTEGVDALVLTGSVAQGRERADSDVDLLFVLADAAYAEHAASDRLSYVVPAPEFGEGLYFDVKVTTRAHLERAVAAADDPMRASVVGARLLWARDAAVRPTLTALLDRIVRPDEKHWARQQAAFMAQARLQGWYFLKQADEHGNRLLLHHAATHLVFALGRALLALNHELFPGPKYLEARLSALPLAPRDIVERFRGFLDDPTAAAGAALLDEVEALADWPLERGRTLSRFVEDNELAWLTGVVPPEYR